MIRAAASAPGDLRLLVSHARQGRSHLESLRVLYRLLPVTGRRWDLIYFNGVSAALDYLPLFDLGRPVVINYEEFNADAAVSDLGVTLESVHAALRRASAIHCASETISQKAVGLGLEPAKIRIIRPAVDHIFFHPPEEGRAPSKEFRVITAGPCVWAGGFEFALLAIRRLTDQGIPARFDIICSGDADWHERERILYTIRDLELDDRVRLHEGWPLKEVRNHLQQSDVFLISSLQENTSCAALAAMACGLPVVTNDCGGILKMVTDGVEGLIVPARDPEAMAGALAVLREDAGLRFRMGRAGRQRVESSFTLSQQVEQLVSLYQRVLSGAE